MFAVTAILSSVIKIRGLFKSTKWRHFENVKFEALSARRVFMQETHLTSKSQQGFRAQWMGDVTFSHVTSSARGVCIAFRPNLEKKIFSPLICDENERFIIVYVEIQGSPFVLINCYAPNAESAQVKLFKEISTELGKLDFGEDAQFILAGDWNLIFDTFLDSLGGKPKLNKRSIFQLKSVMEDFAY